MGIDRLSAALLAKYEGLGISKICKNDLHAPPPAFNHCAHFVNHVLGLRFGYTCRNQTGKGTAATAANVRVHELFAQCPEVGAWPATAPASSRIAFITDGRNVNLGAKVMVNAPRKHVGIYCGGSIWHYSNSKGRVVKQTPDQFAKHYTSTKTVTYKLFFGSFPAGADPVEP